MSKDKIPTAEEALRKRVFKVPNENSHWGENMNEVISLDDAIKIVNAQNKLHVEAALKEATKVKDQSGNEPFGSFKYDILHCYPLDNIK